MSGSDYLYAVGPGVGGGLGAWAGLRFVRWLVEFIAQRMDLRAVRLDLREKAIEAKFNQRLAHVERELALYRTATMRLVNAMAQKNPQDPVLQQVADILRQAVPMDAPNSDLDELLARARRSDEADE